jgi:hypothetical protein
MLQPGNKSGTFLHRNRFPAEFKLTVYVKLIIRIVFTLNEYLTGLEKWPGKINPLAPPAGNGKVFGRQIKPAGFKTKERLFQIVAYYKFKLNTQIE